MRSLTCPIFLAKYVGLRAHGFETDDWNFQEVYKGEVLHSFDYKSAYKWTGKTGVVVGSANTGKLWRLRSFNLY